MRVRRLLQAVALAVASLDPFGEGCFAAVRTVQARVSQAAAEPVPLPQIYEAYRALAKEGTAEVRWGAGPGGAHLITLPPAQRERLRREAAPAGRRAG